jgi:hypothetical protein
MLSWNVDECKPPADGAFDLLHVGRGLHSSTFQLNVSALC